MASSILASVIKQHQRHVHPEDDSAPSAMQIQQQEQYEQESNTYSFSPSDEQDEDEDDQDERYSLDRNNQIPLILPVDNLVEVSTRPRINRKKKKKDTTASSQIIDHHHSTQNSPVDQQRTRIIDETPISPAVNPNQNSREQIEELNNIISNTRIPFAMMEKLIQQNPILSPSSSNRPGGGSAASPSPTRADSRQRSPSPSKRSPSRYSSGPAEVTVYPSSVSLRGLLSYQDVMSAIEREFHLHDGQEREIIMKLWLKGQTMISILQRYRYLLQDLNLDDQDFLGGMKQIREMISYADRDVQYLREQKEMLENQNRFLESEFQRQLDKVVNEKNEQISRLIHIIDQTCPPPNEYVDSLNEANQPAANTDLLAQKFMQQNVELHRELETLRAKLEYTFALLNEKLEQPDTSSSIVQMAIEQIRQSDAKLEELQWKSTSQKEENDILRYLIERSSQSSTVDPVQLFHVIEQRSLEREIDRVRQELELTEKKLAELEQRFDHSDEAVQFNIERLKLKCDVLRQHIDTCHQRLDETVKELPTTLTTDLQVFRQDTLTNAGQRQENIELENDLLAMRDRYNKLAEYTNQLNFELENARKQLNERSLLGRESFESSVLGNESAEVENERRRSAQLENELFALKIKYEDVCERVTAATLQLERVQVVLEQTLRRCEQLEKEKSEINAQSEHLSQNVATITAKYKDKINTIKSRLEQTDRQRREAHLRSEQLQNEIERLKTELNHKKEMIFEKEKMIQDVQYKNREILLERQSVEDRISNEYKRLNELVDKNRYLEEELERMRRGQILENITVRRTDVINLDAAALDASNRLDEFRNKINEYERRCAHEKAARESLQIQMKILEEENADLRDVMSQMRKRAQDDRRDDRDRNDEIQQLIARAESNARQYMTNFNLSSVSPTSTLVRIIPVSSPTKFS